MLHFIDLSTISINEPLLSYNIIVFVLKKMKSIVIIMPLNLFKMLCSISYLNYVEAGVQKYGIKMMRKYSEINKMYFKIGI